MKEFWQGRRVLVTGGTRLIGSWLVNDLLGCGAEVAVERGMQDTVAWYRALLGHSAPQSAVKHSLAG